MSQGGIVELGPVDQILEAPANPYTRRLLSDTPSLEVALSAAESG
jgi:ABC-type dipeptide/oligopeptide/nickel transport system ATPase component